MIFKETDLIKGHARLFEGKVLVGFAGGAADAFSLFEKFEGFLEQYRGHLKRATVELARLWRSDKILREILEKNRLRRVVIHTVGVGRDHVRDFMRALATRTGGQYVAR